MSNVAAVVLLAVGVKFAVRVKPAPVSPLSVPPVTTTSLRVKLVPGSSLNVKVIGAVPSALAMVAVPFVLLMFALPAANTTTPLAFRVPLPLGLSFGLMALLYLVTEELLVEAHEKPDSPLISAMFFVGFLALLLIEEIMA